MTLGWSIQPREVGGGSGSVGVGCSEASGMGTTTGFSVGASQGGAAPREEKLGLSLKGAKDFASLKDSSSAAASATMVHPTDAWEVAGAEGGGKEATASK